MDYKRLAQIIVDADDEVNGGTVLYTLEEFLKQHLEDHHSGFIVMDSDRTKLICGSCKKSHFPNESCSPIEENEILVGEKVYPCSSCGKLRTKDEGGTIFTLCDKCWDIHFCKVKPKACDHKPFWFGSYYGCSKCGATLSSEPKAKCPLTCGSCGEQHYPDDACQPKVDLKCPRCHAWSPATEWVSTTGPKAKCEGGIK